MYIVDFLKPLQLKQVINMILKLQYSVRLQSELERQRNGENVGNVFLGKEGRSAR